VHDGSGPFEGLPRGVRVMRYHSWTVDATSLPPILIPTAWSDDGTLMGMAHRERPWWGLQFHPESVGTPTGPAMIGRFLTRIRRTRATEASFVVRADR